MKKVQILILMFLFAAGIHSQQQIKIPWPSLADSPWPFIRGDMQGTGRSEYIGPSSNNVIWRKDMPLGVIYGPIIGFDDMLIMGERAVSPDPTNYIYAVDNFGNDIWTFSTNSFLPNNINPIIGSDSTIYFANASKDLYAITSNGEFKWMIDDIMWGTPHCYITLAKNGDLYVPSADTLVIVSNEGVVKEKRTIEGLKGRSFMFSTGGDTVFYFTGGGGFYDTGAVNAATLDGTLLWSYEFLTHNLGAPLVDNSNKVYVFGTDTIAPNMYYLYCIKPDGSLDWRYKIDRYEDYSTPTIDNSGNIIFPAISAANPDGENIIISLDYSGNENWTTVLPGDFFSSVVDHGLVCDAEEKIYFGPTFGGYFYCLSNTGEILWRLDLGELEYDSSPAIGSDGTLYIGTHLSSTFQNHTQNLIAIRDTGASSVDDSNFLNEYSLNQNFPNPFNPYTTIKYSIPERSYVTLKIFDILGKVVATLISEEKSRGEYSVLFEGSNLSSGIYFYRLQAEKYIATKKLILLR